MQRFAALLAVLALGGACRVDAAPAARGSGPRLTIVRGAPLTVHGTGFAGNERVRVTARTTTRTAARSVRAGTDGAFTVRLPGIRVTRCGDAAIPAVGARGDRARLVRHRGVASCNTG